MPRPISFELRDACVDFDGHAACAGLDLDIGRGEMVAFVGPSGAGKTTALRLLNQTVRPKSGIVRADGVDLATLSDASLRALRARIGVIPQDLGLVPNLRVSQNVLAGRLGRQGTLRSLGAILFPPRAQLERVLALLDRLGVGEKLYHRVDSLSGGEMQRVAIARALYQEAGALLADEPLSALDPARSRETIQLLVTLAREHELTLVLSMHDIALAREFVPRLVGLRDGRVLFDDRTEVIAEERYGDLYRLEGLTDSAGASRRGG